MQSSTVEFADEIKNLRENVMRRRARSFSEAEYADDVQYCATGDCTPTYKRNSYHSSNSTTFPGTPVEQPEAPSRGDDVQTAHSVAQAPPVPNPFFPGHVGPQMYVLSVTADGSQILTPVIPAPLTVWNPLHSPPCATQPVCPAQQQNLAQSPEARAEVLDIQAAEAVLAAKRGKAAGMPARKRTGPGWSGKKERSMTPASASTGFAGRVAACAGNRDFQVHDNDDRTTLMLRNLPNSYNRAALLHMLDSEGFKGRYSFVYLPADFNHFAGFGYAFVGFETHACAEIAKRHFQGFTNWRHFSQKMCDVAWSGEVQGNKAYVEKYRNSPVMHDSVPDEYKPALFVNGLRVPFPAPTKRIRPPRVRHLTSG